MSKKIITHESECVCGMCPTVFKSSDGETDEYICLFDEELLFRERRLCIEEIGKISFYLAFGNSNDNNMDNNTKNYLNITLEYWKNRLSIINNEIKRRGKWNKVVDKEGNPADEKK